MSAELLARIAELEAEIARLKQRRAGPGRPRHPKTAEVQRLILAGEKQSVIQLITGASEPTIRRIRSEMKAEQAKE